MSQQFDAIYENGVLRPLKPVDLKEHEVVSVSILPVASPDAALARADRQREALRTFMEKMEALDEELPDDLITNRDHDRVIYDGPAEP